MKPKSRPESSQLQLFQAQLEQLLNHDHPLFVLAGQIDWARFDTALSECYSPDQGAPAKAVRLLVGLHYLKHAFNESDESLVERWVENPYWQYFCGFETMQHELPLHPTSLTKWRQRVGADKLAELLGETIALALRDHHVTEQELAQVNVDTTVEEKNITYPTDSKLLHKAIVKLGQAAKQRALPLRQTYVRVAKKAGIMASRYAHAKQFKRMRRELRKLRTWLGRVIRDVRRKRPEPDEALETLLQLCERLHVQQPTDSNKLYSLHEVRCEVHQQRQGAPTVRIRPEGHGRHDQHQQLDGRREALRRQSVRRTHARCRDHYDRANHGCAGHRCLCRQRLSRPRLPGRSRSPYRRQQYEKTLSS
jgi:transposase, IS5 family